MRKIVSENNLVFIITDQGLFYNNIPLEYIDKGEEGSVYRYQDKAIKIYHDYPRKTTANLELLKVLKTIDTKRILMPIDILMESSTKAKGYITPFIEGNKDIVYNYPKDKLLEELSFLDDDFSTLGKESITIGDLRESNYLSNETGFFLFDYGDYYQKPRKIDTTSTNVEEFQIFFLYNLVSPKLKQEASKLKLSEQKVMSIYRKTRYEITHHRQGLVDYLAKNMNNEENLNNYVKRLIRR